MSSALEYRTHRYGKHGTYSINCFVRTRYEPNGEFFESFHRIRRSHRPAHKLAYELHRDVAGTVLRSLPKSVWHRSEGPRLLNSLISRTLNAWDNGCCYQKTWFLEIDTTVATDAVALVWSSEMNVREQPSD